SSDLTKSITEAINNPDNQIFCANHEIELLENTEDFFILANTRNFSELEQEKSMPNGEILRQCLRLSMTTAVCHCMKCRFQKFDSSKLSNSTLTQKTSNKDPLEILQELDVQRLRAIIYRDVVRSDRTLAIVYFVWVLMVSRYRDIIETNLSRQASIISTTPGIRHGSTSEINVDTASINDSTSITNNQKNNGESAVIDDNNEINKINSIDMNNTSATAISYERALSNIAPFLCDLFIEYSHILTKKLLPSGLHALKQTASIVELVMLLFNEGRLLSHTSKDHVVKVANEADFILNRMRADDICKASEFEQLSAQTTVERKSEEQLYEHFITGVRQRHQVIASHDLRRRQRLIRNPNGSIHSEAKQKSSFNDINDDIITSVIQEENLLKQQKIQNFNQTISDDDEKDLDQDFSGPICFSTECSINLWYNYYIWYFSYDT
ncbi:unnamed protein product, partial [Rotaria sp. Silwood1]